MDVRSTDKLPYITQEIAPFEPLPKKRISKKIVENAFPICLGWGMKRPLGKDRRPWGSKRGPYWERTGDSCTDRGIRGHLKTEYISCVFSQNRQKDSLGQYRTTDRDSRVYRTWSSSGIKKEEAR